MMKLTDEAQKLRAGFLAEFEITDRAGLEILDRAVESFSRMREAEAILERDGLTVLNRFGEVREHPALNTERKARAQFLLAVKQLNLDVQPPNHSIGRPPGR